MIQAILDYKFLQYAVITAVFASIICGIIGVIIIEKKLILMTGGIAHTCYGGVGLGYMLGFQPIIGAFIFSFISAITIGFVKRKGGIKDVIIALFWSLGMALGIFFIALTPGYPPNISLYLFGNILSVLKSELYMIIITTVVIASIIFIFFNDWKVYLFDEEFAFISGKNTAFMDYLLFIIIAFSIVALMKVAGIILVIALLTAPAATAALFTKSLLKRMLLAICFGIVYCLLGLWFSYQFNMASGASIVILSVIFLSIIYLIKIINNKIKKALS